MSDIDARIAVLRDTAHLVELAEPTANGNHPEQQAGIDVETWHQFASKATDTIPALVDGLWAENALGFIAAAPKAGKTWLGLALALAVATGKPFLGVFTVPHAHPVLYVALEGHRAGLRARIGAIARGMGLDPDGDDLQDLHFAYKPPGINLSDPGWARDLTAATDDILARLTIVDVLRAAARLRENDASDFAALRYNLEPVAAAGCSLCLLHHFGKLNETQKERTPGERMSGSGSMFGALDAAIYITGSENNAKRMRLEFDARDIAAPDTTSVELTGEGTGPNGGYAYLDTATFGAVDDVPEDRVKVTSEEIRDYVAEHGGEVRAVEIRAHFEISSDTLTRRLGRLRELGITHETRRGQAGSVLTYNEESYVRTSMSAPLSPHADIEPDADIHPHNHAGLRSMSAHVRTKPCGHSESGDLQRFSMSAMSASLRDEPTQDAAAHPEGVSEPEPETPADEHEKDENERNAYLASLPEEIEEP